eukprot:jgi/Chlat1/2857/Chrsp194S03004
MAVVQGVVAAGGGGVVLPVKGAILLRRACIKQCFNRSFRRTSRATAAGGGSVAALPQGARKVPKVKVCGITTPEDAKLAAGAGADFIGMIMWPGSKRYVSVDVGSEIAAAARKHGATPVAVFVDGTADTIAGTCAAMDVGIAQLHGDAARQALNKLPASLDVIYVLSADKSGKLQTELPSRDGARAINWLLIDGVVAGSGEAYDWQRLKVPQDLSANGWLLAGGLHPDNVADAIAAAQPDVVDVASGVAGPDGVRKSMCRVLAFMEAVHGSLNSNK